MRGRIPLSPKADSPLRPAPMVRNLVVELPSVSVIIPAYNEEKYLGTTIAQILETQFPCEIIVVDDGSTDRTPLLLEEFQAQVRVVRHPVNLGKGAALASGIRAATGEIVVFCDAHLLGLKQYHLLSLVLPLVQGSARAVLGATVSGTPIFPLVGMPVLTGQRAYFRRDLEPLLDRMRSLGYGVELFLFRCFPREQTAVVLLPGLVHLLKHQFRSPAAAARGYFRESVEIAATLMQLGGMPAIHLSFWRRKLVSD